MNSQSAESRRSLVAKRGGLLGANFPKEFGQSIVRVTSPNQAIILNVTKSSFLYTQKTQKNQSTVTTPQTQIFRSWRPTSSVKLRSRMSSALRVSGTCQGWVLCPRSGWRGHTIHGWAKLPHAQQTNVTKRKPWKRKTMFRAAVLEDG